jgi:hypothetical protein
MLPFCRRVRTVPRVLTPFVEPAASSITAPKTMCVELKRLLEICGSSRSLAAADFRPRARDLTQQR